MEAGCYMGAYAAMEDFYNFYGLGVVCVLEVFRLLGFTYILIYGKTQFYKNILKTSLQVQFSSSTVSFQELTIGRSIQVVKWEIKNILEASEGTDKVETELFCASLRACHRAFSFTSASVGRIILLLYSYSVIEVLTLIHSGKRGMLMFFFV